MTHQVLLVDDDDPTRSVYHEILTRMNFEVSEASDGVKAIEFLSQHAPDVVILDLLLPQEVRARSARFHLCQPALDRHAK